MGLLRSEDMVLYEISIPKDNAWDVMNELGYLNIIHFIDLNESEQNFNLVYAGYVKRCEQTMKKIKVGFTICLGYSLTSIWFSFWRLSASSMVFKWSHLRMFQVF